MHSILSIYFFWSPGFCFSSLHWGFSGTAFPPCSFGSLAFFFSSFGFVFSVSPFAPWPPSPESGFLSAPSCPLSVTSPDLPFLLPSFPSFPPCPSHCLRCPSLLAFLFLSWPSAPAAASPCSWMPLLQDPARAADGVGSWNYLLGRGRHKGVRFRLHNA